MINYQEFSEKKVLVTGSSRGIGLAIAKNFAQTGAKVILHGKNENSLKIIRAEFEESGWNVDHVICDLSNVSAVRQMAKNILNNEGRIDILVNNAGINLRNPLKMISDSDWHQTLEVNLSSSFVLCQEISTEMINNGWGRIINIGSIDGINNPEFKILSSLDISYKENFTLPCCCPLINFLYGVK